MIAAWSTKSDYQRGVFVGCPPLRYRCGARLKRRCRESCAPRHTLIPSDSRFWLPFDSNRKMMTDPPCGTEFIREEASTSATFLSPGMPPSRMKWSATLAVPLAVCFAARQRGIRDTGGGSYSNAFHLRGMCSVDIRLWLAETVQKASCTFKSSTCHLGSLSASPSSSLLLRNEQAAKA